MVDMPTCHLQLKMKNKTECPFLMYRLVVKIKHLPPLSIVNLPLVEFIHILTAFYHLPISLVLFTRSLIDVSEYAQVGLNYTLNLFVLRQIFVKMATLKILQINVSKDLWISYVVKETILTVEKKPLALDLSYFGSISVQARTKKTSLKVIKKHP